MFPKWTNGRRWRSRKKKGEGTEVWGEEERRVGNKGGATGMLGTAQRGPSGWVTWPPLTSSPHRCLDPTHSPKPSDHLTLWNPQKQVTERDSHLFLRERDWTGSTQGNWFQWGRIPGNPVFRKTLGFWEVEGWTPCLFSIAQLFALGLASPGSWRPCLSGSQV